MSILRVSARVRDSRPPRACSRCARLARAAGGRGGPSARRAGARLRLRHGRARDAARARLSHRQRGRRGAPHRAGEELLRLHRRGGLRARRAAGRRGPGPRHPRHGAHGRADDQGRERLHERSGGEHRRAQHDRARSRSDLVVAPSPLYLGRVHHGESTRREVSIKPGRAGAAHRVTHVEHTSAFLRTTLEPRPDGPGQRLVVELDRGVPLGRLSETVRLFTTSAREPIMTLTVLGSVEGDVAVLPPQVAFGVARPGDAPERELVIRNRGRRPFAVTRVAVPDEFVTYRLSTAEDGVEYRLALRLRDDLPPGKVEGDGRDLHRPSGRGAPRRAALRHRARARVGVERRALAGVAGWPVSSAPVAAATGRRVPCPPPRCVTSCRASRVRSTRLRRRPRASRGCGEVRPRSASRGSSSCARVPSSSSHPMRRRGGLRRRPALLPRRPRAARGRSARRVHYLPGWEVPPFEALSPTREIVAARSEGLYHLLQTPDPVVVTTVEAWGQRCLPRAVFAERRDLRRRRRDDRTARRSPSGWSSGAITGCRWCRIPGDLALRGGILDVFPRRLRAAGAPRVRRRRRSRASASSTRRSQRSLDGAGGRAPACRCASSASAASGRPRRASSTSARPSSAWRARSAATWSRRCASGLVLPGHRAAPALPLRRARHARRLSCRRHAALAPGGGGGRGRRRGGVGADRGACRRGGAARAASIRRRSACTSPPRRGAARLAGRPRVDVEELELLDGDGARARRPTRPSALGAARRAGGEGPLARRRGAPPRMAAARARGSSSWRRARRAARSHAGAPRAATGSRRRRAAAPVPAGAVRRRDAGRSRSSGELTRGARLPADGLVLVTEAEIFGERRQVRRGRRERPANFLVDARRAQARRLRGARRPRHRPLPRPPAHAGGGHRGRLPAPRVRRRRPPLPPGRPHQRRAALRERRRGRAGARQARRHVLGARQGEDAESLLAMAHELLAGLRGARGARPAARSRVSDALYARVRGALPVRGDARTSSAPSTTCSPTSDAARPMDRLVCGDVGFGKTEVAMRAAFVGRPRRASRWPCSCRRRSSRSSTSRPSAPASRAIR